MKDILNFKNMQDMCNEADDFLAKVLDPDIKACAKLLLVSCYAYMDEYISESAKKTYGNLSILIRSEMVKTEFADRNGTANSKNISESKLHSLIKQIPERKSASKVYLLYYNCSDDLKNKAQMHLMNLLLPYYIK